MKKFVIKNSETRFQKAESRFQNAKTRFQNAKTALSRIFFARNWMDSEKKPANTNSSTHCTLQHTFVSKNLES